MSICQRSLGNLLSCCFVVCLSGGKCYLTIFHSPPFREPPIRIILPANLSFLIWYETPSSVIPQIEAISFAVILEFLRINSRMVSVVVLEVFVEVFVVVSVVVSVVVLVSLYTFKHVSIRSGLFLLLLSLHIEL